MAKAYPNWLKPTPLSIIVVLVVLLAQAVFFSSTSTSFPLFSDDAPERTIHAIGVGSPISIITGEGKTNLQIRWVILALNLTATCTVSVLIAAALMKLTRLRRPATIYGYVILVAITVTFLVSIGISKVYWGYFFSKPALLQEVDVISQVKAIMPFKTESDGSGKRTIVHDNAYSLAERLASGKKYGDDSLEGRILVELERRNLLPPTFATSLDTLPELYAQIQSSGVLAKSSKGYDSSERLSGIVVDAVDKSGNRLVVLGLTGGQLSNDHYPYYEMLFRGQKDSGDLSFTHGQRFFYDAAGMEGFEWYLIWLLLCVPGIVLGFAIFTIGRVFWKWKTREA